MCIKFSFSNSIAVLAITSVKAVAFASFGLHNIGIHP
jgi:hypothetical protein